MDKKIAFVVGAGASAEAGLPTGKKLRDNIRDLLNFRFENQVLTSGDADLKSALDEIAKAESGGSVEAQREKLHSFIKGGEAIYRALPQENSIDGFIESRKGEKPIEICGKLAIAKAILTEEKKSEDLYLNPDKEELNYTKLEETWYSRFFKILKGGSSLENLPERLSSVALIIFNYDRCIEHFLFHSFINFFTISEQESAELVGKILICHPYGSCGALPWQILPPSQKRFRIHFGGKPDIPGLVSLSQEIRTYSEGIAALQANHENTSIHDVRAIAAECERVVFLGFGFHPQNMNLIAQDGNTKVVDQRMIPSVSERFASVYKMSKSNQRECNLKMRKGIRWKNPINQSRVEMANLTCKDFMEDFSMSIRF